MKNSILQHDFPEDCQGDSIQGNYLMHKSGVRGYLQNNYKLSKCSYHNITFFFSAMKRQDRDCLDPKVPQSICGNGIGQFSIYYYCLLIGRQMAYIHLTYDSFVLIDSKESTLKLIKLKKRFQMKSVSLSSAPHQNKKKKKLTNLRTKSKQMENVG